MNTSRGTWTVLQDHGRTGSAVTTLPVTVPSSLVDKDSPYLEYIINLADTGKVKVFNYISPTIDFHNGGGLR